MTLYLNHDILEIKFVRFKEYINSLFSKHSITLICPSDKLGLVSKKYNERFIVKCACTTLEGNLRMIESYMPELLFYFVVNDYCTTGTSIQSLINSNIDLGATYVKYKLFNLFESMVFSEFFDSVFRGVLNVNTCYALKTDDLQYFTTAYSGKLFDEVISALYFDVNRYQNRTSEIVEIKMFYKQKPH